MWSGVQYSVRNENFACERSSSPIDHCASRSIHSLSNDDYRYLTRTPQIYPIRILEPWSVEAHARLKFRGPRPVLINTKQHLL